MYRFTQFEVPSNTSINTIAFYNQVFGWTFQPSTNCKKWTARAESSETRIFGNPFIKNKRPAQAITNAIEVKDIDTTLVNIQEEGGIIIVPKFMIPSVGWMAYFKDLEQNVFGIIQLAS